MKKIKKNLNLFTYDYPFAGNDSDFIEDEINEISKIFHQVNIIPFKKTGKILNTFKKKKNIKFNFELSKYFSTKKVFSRQNLNILLKILVCKYFWYQLANIKSPFFFKKFIMTIKERILAEFIHLFLKNNQFDTKNDVFYSYWSNHTLFGFFFSKIKYSFARTLGSDLNGFLPEDNFVPFLKYKFKKLKFLLILNYGQKIKLLSKNLLEEEKIIKCYQGIPKQINLENYNKKKTEIFFLSCGSLIDVKNTKQIINLMFTISKLNPKLKINYLCIGRGKYKNDLVKYSKNHPRNLFISFIDYVPNLVNFIKKNKINYFVNLSKSEGMSFAVMEAMSCGVPVICSNIPGNLEIVDNRNGFILKNYSSISLKKISEKIINNFYSNKNYLLKRNNTHKVIIKRLCRKNNLNNLSIILLKQFVD